MTGGGVRQNFQRRDETSTAAIDAAVHGDDQPRRPLIIIRNQNQNTQNNISKYEIKVDIVSSIYRKTRTNKT